MTPQVRMAALVSLMFLVLGSWTGHQKLQSMETDAGSEKQAIDDALATVEGRSRYGLVNYTHYPNGPSYILIPFLKLGMGHVDSNQLRVVPLGLGVFSFAALLFALWVVIKNRFLRWVLTFGLLCLFLQRGILYWLGALHQHSYATSLTLLAMAVALLVKEVKVPFLILGYIAGWMGYDPIPTLVFCALTVRWAWRIRGSQILLRNELVTSIHESLWMAGGILLAIGSHFIQNTLYFGSVSIAYQDLIGSAATRMGLEAGAQLNPSYYQSIEKAASGASVTRWSAAEILIQAFLYRGYLGRSFWILGLLGSIIASWASWWIFLRASGSAPLWKRRFTLISITLLGVFLSASAWIILMPKHAFFHPHFFPRHFFMSLTALFIAPALLASRES